jgi:hypothetical protein
VKCPTNAADLGSGVCKMPVRVADGYMEVLRDFLECEHIMRVLIENVPYSGVKL